jgi:hypothetical protein
MNEESGRKKLIKDPEYREAPYFPLQKNCSSVACKICMASAPEWIRRVLAPPTESVIICTNPDQ